MGTLYDLVSDSAREGYELGKGPWGYKEFSAALRSSTPVESVHEFLVEAGAGMGWGKFEPLYAEEIARAVVQFVANHPDWKIMNDASGDYDLLDSYEFYCEGVPNDPLWPTYLRIGSRFQPTEEPQRTDVKIATDDDIRAIFANMEKKKSR